MDVAELERNANEYILHAVRREKRVIFARAQGARLWDVHGKEYLDTMSGSAGPAMVGYAHPLVAEAVGRQMACLPSVNLLHDSVPVIEFCTEMARLAPKGLTKTFLCAGGGEAIEAALKLALRVTERTEVLSLTGAYHGMSLATMGLCGMSSARKSYPPGLTWPNFHQVPSADIYRPVLGSEHPDGWRAAVDALEWALEAVGEDRVAALLMEVVQGPAGHLLFPPEFYHGVQRLCRERRVLLIVDEIQTGLARCGTRWACDLFGVQPDILVAGKALGGGVPIGVFITRKDLIPEGLEAEMWHMLTFMNQPLAAAAALAVLGIVEKERLAERAKELGAKATARFKEMAKRYDVIGDVRGPGLFIGVDFVEDRTTKDPASSACREAWDYAIERGLVCQFGGVGGNVLKFKPPLTTPEEDFERMLDLVEDIAAFVETKVHKKGSVGA